MTCKPVAIFVLLCCAADVASASVVSSSGKVASDPAKGQSPLMLSIVGDSSSDWSLPANLRLDDSIDSDFQNRSINATIKSDSEGSFWITPPDNLATPARTLIAQSLQSGEFHASDTIATISTASVAIPLPSALDATATLAPVGLLALWWKKSRRGE